MRGTSLISSFALTVAVLMVSGALLTVSPAPARAGFFDRVRDVFEIPGEVDKLKEQYQEVRAGYDTALQQLQDQKRQAEEARAQAEEYRKMQERLMEDNAGLAEQNRQLAETVQELRNSEEARSKQSGRIKTVIWTAVLLVAGYFGISRIARYVMRARARG